MPQGALPFQYAEEKGSTGKTALSGLATYLDLAWVAGLSESARRHVGIKDTWVSKKGSRAGPTAR